MKKVEMTMLDYRKGTICPDLSINNFQDLLEITPFAYFWHSVAGSSEDSLSVFVKTDGSGLQDDSYELKQWTQVEYADPYIEDVEETAPSIGESIYSLTNIKAYGNPLALSLHRINTNRNIDVWEYLPIAELDWTKIRRRIEDALRKTVDKGILFNFAQELGVKLD